LSAQPNNTRAIRHSKDFQKILFHGKLLINVFKKGNWEKIIEPFLRNRPKVGFLHDFIICNSVENALFCSFLIAITEIMYFQYMYVKFKIQYKKCIFPQNIAKNLDCNKLQLLIYI
jgi:hypothetical protein